ncbi:MAG TPA: hypothetical protein PKI20_10625 [Verrucomicrobiota bacterium]|nr:hypothetical protein [Verrucomicrobiota bacterium]
MSDCSRQARDGIQLWGQGFVAGPLGEVLGKGSPAREENLFVPLDLNKMDDTRTHWPFLRDRRIDACSGLTERPLN